MNLNRRKFIKTASGIFVPAVVGLKAYGQLPVVPLQRTPVSVASACAAGATFASTWAARVVINGGAAPSQVSINAVANFQCGLITDSLDTRMIVWSAFISDNLIASITPQLTSLTAGFGGGPTKDPWTNTNFVAGDLNVSGLKGNGSNKSLDTGVQPQGAAPIGIATDNCGVTFYVTGTQTTGCVAGCDNGGNSQFLFASQNTLYAWTYPGAITSTNTGWTGYIACTVIPTHQGAIYKANSITPHAALVTGALGNGGLTVPPYTIAAFGFRNNTGTIINSDARLGFLSVNLGLSSAQSALLYARVQTLMTDLGRQV